MRTIAILLLSTITCFAQGEYLKKDETGLGIVGNFSLGNDVSAFGGSIGFSLNGIFDLSFSAGTGDIEDPILGTTNATFVSPEVGIHFLKQNENFPVSLVATAGYSKIDYSSGLLDRAEIDLSAWGISAGLGVYKQIEQSPVFTLIPQAEVIYTSTKGTIKYNSGESESETDGNTSFAFGLGLQSNRGSGMLILTPAIGISESDLYFSILAGYIFKFL